MSWTEYTLSPGSAYSTPRCDACIHKSTGYEEHLIKFDPSMAYDPENHNIEKLWGFSLDKGITIFGIPISKPKYILRIGFNCRSDIKDVHPGDYHLYAYVTINGKAQTSGSYTKYYIGSYRFGNEIKTVIEYLGNGIWRLFGENANGVRKYRDFNIGKQPADGFKFYPYMEYPDHLMKLWINGW